MGNDGGSIPKRDDLVKTKKSTSTNDKKSKNRIQFSTCHLSKDPLTPPIVSCPLGNLYNKESILSYLLSPTLSTHSEVSHIRSLRDLTTLVLTPNPSLSFSPNQDTQDILETEPQSSFVCPISLREMNGAVKFVYRKPGGTVISESALKELRKEGGDTRVDPVTGVRDKDTDQEEEWVTINPSGKEAEAMRERWEEVRKREKEEKRLAKEEKKRKSGGEGGEEKKVKQVKLAGKDELPSIHAGVSIKGLNKQLEESKKEVSKAVASLYAPKDDGTNKDKDGRSNWMTRGAFTRYA